MKNFDTLQQTECALLQPIDLANRPKSRQTLMIFEEQKTATQNEVPSNSASFKSNSTNSPFLRNLNLKSAQADPGLEAGKTLNKPGIDEFSQLHREAIFFKKYACLCPGTSNIEVLMQSDVFR